MDSFLLKALSCYLAGIEDLYLECSRSRIMAMDHPAEPGEDLSEYLHRNGQAVQSNGNRANDNDEDAKESSNGNAAIPAGLPVVTDDEIESFGEALPMPRILRTQSEGVEQVSSQSLSSYRASRQRDRQIRMATMMANQTSLEKEISFEPDDLGRSASLQPGPSVEGPPAAAASLSSSFSSYRNDNIYVPTSPTFGGGTKRRVDRPVPSSAFNFPKSTRLNRQMQDDMDIKARNRQPTRPRQDPAMDDINSTYQALRQQRISTSNPPASVPFSTDDTNEDVAPPISPSKGTRVPASKRAVPTTRAASNMDSDDLTQGRDGDRDDHDANIPSSPRAGWAARQTVEGAQNGAPTAASPPTDRKASPDDRNFKAEFARNSATGRAPLDERNLKSDPIRNSATARRVGAEEVIPSQSEHGTNSTIRNSQRHASLYPSIDDNDPQAASRRLEAQLLSKSRSLHDPDRDRQRRENNTLRNAYDRTLPGAHEISAPATFLQNRGGDRRPGFERYDSYLTNQDHYLVTATVVKEDEDEEERRRLARDKSERFRLLESRQADLEEQIAEQKRLILAHHEELNRLKTTRADIVQAEVVGQIDVELDRKIKQRESIIALKKAELDSLMIPGMDLLKKFDHRSDKKKKGGIMKKLNPFRKTSIDTIGELDDNSSHSLHTASNHSSQSKRLHASQHKSVVGSESRLREAEKEGAEEEEEVQSHSSEQDVASRDGAEIDVSNRQSLLAETRKRSERFIAPEKLPFEDNTISELKQIAEEANVDISGCVERGQIVKKLESAGVKPKKKGALNKLFHKSPKPVKNSLGKSSTHSANKSPQKGSKRSIESLPDNITGPVFGEKRDFAFVPKPADKFEGISISQLKKIARDHNVDVSTCSDRNDLVNVLYAAGLRPPGQGGSAKDTFDDFSISELKTLARANRVDISSCVEKSQIVAELRAAGVRPPKKGTPSYPGTVTWESLTISDVKRMADEHNVDVSKCVEKPEIVAMLRRSGVTPTSHAPRLTRSELSDWRPAQLQILASQVGGPSPGTAGSKELLNKILRVVNEEKKHLRGPVRSIAQLGSAPLSKIRTFASEKKVDISNCVEKDEMLRRIIQTTVR